MYVISYSATSILVRGTSQHITITIHKNNSFIQYYTKNTNILKHNKKDVCM